MGKKGRNTAAEPTAATPVNSRDSLQRLSYLYQASVLLNSALAGAAKDASQQRKAQKRRRRARQAMRSDVHEGETTDGDQLMKEQKGEDASVEPENAGHATVSPAERPRRRTDDLQPVARHAAREMKEVAKKATIRM